jgi:hypothetical protein
MDLAQLFDECSVAPFGFPHPDWSELRSRIQAEIPEETGHEDALVESVNRWIDAVAGAMQPRGHVFEAERFVLATSQHEHAPGLLEFFDDIIRSIERTLPGIVEFGELPVLTSFLFEDLDQYYSYIEHFDTDGEIAASGGMFLNTEVPHFVAPFTDPITVQTAAAHEITHFCLSPLPVPLWLDEGLAMTMQAVIMREPALTLDPLRWQEHRECWNHETIQMFWSGEAWRSPETNDLAYELARMAVRTLGSNQTAFREFVRTAHYEDAGQSAIQLAYGRGLEGLLEQFFGSGDWAPERHGPLHE